MLTRIKTAQTRLAALERQETAAAQERKIRQRMDKQRGDLAPLVSVSLC